MKNLPSRAVKFLYIHYNIRGARLSSMHNKRNRPPIFCAVCTKKRLRLKFRQVMNHKIFYIIGIGFSKTKSTEFRAFLIDLVIFLRKVSFYQRRGYSRRSFSHPFYLVLYREPRQSAGNGLSLFHEGI